MIFYSAAISDSYFDNETVAIPAHQAGDLLIFSASVDGVSTPPSVPAGKTLISAVGADSEALTTGFVIATSSSEVSGAWTGAEVVSVAVYRPEAGETLGIGSTPATFGNNFSSDITYAALTLDNTNNTSWVYTSYGHRSNNVANGEPAGFIQRNKTFNGGNSYQVTSDSNGPTSSFAGGPTGSTTTASAYQSVAIEITVVGGAGGPTIDTPPTEVKATEAFDVVFSSAADPTGVTSATLGAKALTVNSVTGAGPQYTASCTAPLATALKFDPTGYPLIITVDGTPSAPSANIPYLPQTGWVYSDAVDPETVQSWSGYTPFTGNTPITGFQLVQQEVVAGHTTYSEPDGEMVSNPLPTFTINIPRYFIEDTGVVGAQADYQLFVDGGAMLTTPLTAELTINLTTNLTG